MHNISNSKPLTDPQIRSEFHVMVFDSQLNGLFDNLNRKVRLQKLQSVTVGHMCISQIMDQNDK